jgi:hypothetical protein
MNTPTPGPLRNLIARALRHRCDDDRLLPVLIAFVVCFVICAR